MPTGFLVDKSGYLNPRTSISVDDSGNPTIQTIDANGRQVSTLIQSTSTYPAINTPVAKRTATLFGDSIMGYGDNIASGGSGIGCTSQSSIAWASGYLFGSPIHIIANRAIGGTLVDSGANSLVLQLTAALITNADNSDIFHIHSGVNHLNPNIDATLPTVDQIIAKFKRILDWISPQKPLIIVDALTPLCATVTAPSGAMPRRGDIPLVNAGLAALCANYANVKYNDVYTPLALDGFGNADPRFVFPTDGIHLRTWGASEAGKATAQTYKANARLAAGYRVTKGIALMDFSGTSGTKSASGGGTVVGTVCTGLALTAPSGTPSIVATAANNSQRIQVDNTSQSTNTIMQLTFGSSTAYLGSLASGDTVIAYCRLDMAACNLLRRCNPAFQQNPSSALVAIDMLSRSAQENANPPLPSWPPSFSCIFSTQPFALTAALTSAQLAITFEIAAGGSMDITVSGYGYNGVTAV